MRKPNSQGVSGAGLCVSAGLWGGSLCFPSSPAGQKAAKLKPWGQRPDSKRRFMKSKKIPRPTQGCDSFTFEGSPGISLVPCLKPALCRTEEEEKEERSRS